MPDYLEKSQMNCISCECKSPLFQLLTDEELEMVQENRINVVFKPGETIRKQGTSMTHVLSVNCGLAKLYLEGIEHRNAILRLVKPTNFIGGPGIYLDLMHHYTVTALIESSVCFIDIHVFKKIIKQNNPFAEEFMKDFSRNTLAVYNRLINLTQKQMPGRMSDTLLYLFNDIFQSNKFPMLISKLDLADLSAMSKDSAVKVLREFQNEGIIRVTDNEMELLDAEALKKISRIG
jgi:CRP/FNR family transcriptional regulator, polysaccharide utilization system transcription regulator